MHVNEFVCLRLCTSVRTCVTELVMWTELFMSGQTGQQHVTVTRGLNGENGEGEEGAAMVAVLCKMWIHGQPDISMNRFLLLNVCKSRCCVLA